MQKIRTILLAAMSVALLSSGLVLSSAGTADAAACNTVRHVETSGAEADWNVSCSGNWVHVFGNVTDTAADGECARVYAIWNDGGVDYSAKACPKGQTKEFDFSWHNYTNASNAASVYLQEL